MNKDLLTNISKPETAAHTFRLLTVQQNVPAHLQLCGAAAMLQLLCDHYDIPPQEVWTVVSKLLQRDHIAEEDDRQFQAVRDYIRYELK